MADFRKWLLVLAVAAFAVSGYAQTSTTISCSATPAQPPVLRDGGLAELVGDAVFNCVPSAGSSVFAAGTANWEVFMSGQVAGGLGFGNVTNRFTATNTPAIIVSGNETDAAGAFVARHDDVYLGNTVAGLPNAVLFPTVTIPTGTSFAVRIVNIRIVAPPSSGGGLPTAVQEFVSTTTTSGSATPINALVTVGTVLPAMTFSVTACDGTAGGTTTFQQCISQPRLAGALHFGLKFTELFPTAFRTLGPESTTVGQGFVGESGLHFTGTNGKTTRELATQATQLMVTFTGIPAGVSILVTPTEMGSGVSTAGATADIVPDATHKLVSVDVTCNEAVVTDNRPIGSPTPVPSPMASLVDITADMTATWEIQTINPGALDSLVFGVEVKFTAQTSANLPGLTTAPGGHVAGTLAPVSTDVTPNPLAPTPRFNIPPVNAGAPFAIVPCVTNLLFPYVTNRAGYDTGIALVNTSLDNGTGSTDNPAPFDTQTQHGTCTVYFFPHTAVGVAAVAPQTTRDIPAGDTETFTMGNPPAEFTAGATAGFEGYIIARCNFQYAHGFAFIVDGTVPGFGSEGYLALIIPDRGVVGRPPEPSACFSGNCGGEGEQLNQ